jgi:tartrate-resistant acid phosphatase type 5
MNHRYFLIIFSLLLTITIACDDQSLPSTPIGLGGLNNQPTENFVCDPVGSNGEVVGASCDCGGQYVCNAGQYVCLGGSEPNPCGGCSILSDQPQTACGLCGMGQWQCSNLDQVICQGDPGENICGGCATIMGNIGDSCGTCGSLSCSGTEALTCSEAPRNACGGCGVLEGTVGGECGACGVWTCAADGSQFCDDPGPEVCREINFIVMGDTGEANEAQYRVAEGAQARCDRSGGCEGFLMLGDNIYDTGAASPTDVQLTTKIDLPYAELKSGPPPVLGAPDNRLRMPIYVSLGNHDLGGAGLNSFQVQNYLVYGQAQDWFYYPSEFWELQIGHVHLVSLHTNPLAYGFPADLFAPQGDLVNQVVEGTSASWIVAFGHHPYRSNGKHGNAGAYELGFDLGDFELFGIDLSNAFGDGFREWVDQYVCNRVDFYLSGHDHNRQWLNTVPLTPNLPEGGGTEPCNTHFAVSGAGAKTTELVGRGNDTAFEDDQKEGFLFMSFRRDQVLVEFCDADGNTEWSRVITKE